VEPVNPFLECIGKPTVGRWPTDQRFRKFLDLNASNRGRAKHLRRRKLAEGDTPLARQVRRVGVGRLGNVRAGQRTGRRA
jgi:hypothetical protein